MLKRKGESKQAEQVGNDIVGVLDRIRSEKSRVTRIFWNEQLQHGEQINRNFGVKSFLSQNWGHVFTPKFEKKNTETRSFQDCVIKESIRCESVSIDLDVMSESTILWITSADGINVLYLSGVKECVGLYK